MESFQIANYSVSTYLERVVNDTHIERVLELESTPEYHGYKRRALLVFHTAFTRPWSSRVAGYLYYNPSSPVWISVVGWLDLGEFSYYYDLLRAERPVYCYYRRQDTGPYQNGYLTRVGLGTGVEPVGEGPADPLLHLARATPELEKLISDETSDETSGS